MNNVFRDVVDCFNFLTDHFGNSSKRALQWVDRELTRNSRDLLNQLVACGYDSVRMRSVVANMNRKNEILLDVRNDLLDELEEF